MTLVNIDLRNQGYETSPDDRVVFYSLLVREGDFGTISTAPVEVELTEGKASVDLAPGPVGVQIIAGQVADTRVKLGEVPSSGPTTLNAVMMVTPAYTPALQAAMIAAIERAKDAAVDQVDAEVAQAVDAEVGEFKAKAEQALTKSVAAESKSDAALSKSTTAESSAGNAVSRVEALEVMGGLSPGEPVDGQTANLIAQDGTLTRQALDATYVTPIPDTTVTVGPGGTYATINDAISELSRLLPTHQTGPNSRDGGQRVIILLKSGFVMAEQVFVHRINLGWITIRAEDRPVPVSRAALTVKDYQGTRAAFYGHQGATLPVLDCLFSMDTSGVAGTQSGITLDRGSLLIIEPGTAEKRNGFINVTYRGLNAHDGSRAAISLADFSGAGNVGIRIANSSLCQAVAVKATDCGSMGASVGGAHANFDRADLSRNPVGIRAGGGATVSAAGGTIVNSCGHGLYATEASSIGAYELIANDCTTSGLFALNGGRIDAANATVERSGSHGIHATSSGVINAGGASANNSGGTGVLADFSGQVHFVAGEAIDCHIGVSAQAGGRVVASRATLTGASTIGAFIYSGGWADLSNANLTGAATAGIRCFEGSFAHASGADARRGELDTPQDVQVRTGSTINAHDLVGGISQAPNVLTASGVIYRLPETSA